jgi:hypothetical protein
VTVTHEPGYRDRRALIGEIFLLTDVGE